MRHQRSRRSTKAGVLVAAFVVLLAGCAGSRHGEGARAGVAPMESGGVVDALDAAIGLEALAGWPAVVRVSIDAAGVDAYSAGGPLSGSQELCDATVLESITGTLSPGTPLTVTCSARGVAGGLSDTEAAVAYGLPPVPPEPGAQVGYALTPLPGAPGRFATRRVVLDGSPSIVGPGTPTTAVPRISVQSAGRTESMTVDEFRALASTVG
ncbi:MAG: hypothetical protein ACOYOP_07465 [Microthrixaceae bacterium]